MPRPAEAEAFRSRANHVEPMSTEQLLPVRVGSPVRAERLLPNRYRVATTAHDAPIGTGSLGFVLARPPAPAQRGSA